MLYAVYLIEQTCKEAKGIQGHIEGLHKHNLILYKLHFLEHLGHTICITYRLVSSNKVFNEQKLSSIQSFNLLKEEWKQIMHAPSQF